MRGAPFFFAGSSVVQSDLLVTQYRQDNLSRFLASRL